MRTRDGVIESNCAGCSQEKTNSWEWKDLRGSINTSEKPRLSERKRLSLEIDYQERLAKVFTIYTAKSEKWE